ncbi:MAG: thioredoxin [Deltaproteobacteria bacterium]|nr:thioredoxin [Deltaproteobacteria bacterium]
MASSKIVHLSEDTFDQGVKTGLTLVDFWAEWCGPCLALNPTIDEIAEKYDGKVRVAKVNIDQNPSIPMKFGVRGIPTLILLKDGQQKDMFVGNAPAKIKEMVERAV